MTYVLDKSCRGNQNTHFIFSKVFSEDRTVYEILWKNMVEPDATDDYNMVHAHCVMDNYGYRHNTLGICNACCFSLATTLTETLLNGTFIRTLPSCYYILLLTVTYLLHGAESFLRS